MTSTRTIFVHAKAGEDKEATKVTPARFEALATAPGSIAIPHDHLAKVKVKHKGGWDFRLEMVVRPPSGGKQKLVGALVVLPGQEEMDKSFRAMGLAGPVTALAEHLREAYAKVLR